jgi:hypothetical protein
VLYQVINHIQTISNLAVIFSSYPCGNDLCSEIPTQCQPPIEPQPTGYCPKGQHYCGGSCPFSNEAACKGFYEWCGDETFINGGVTKKQSYECILYIYGTLSSLPIEFLNADCRILLEFHY